jgi:hypothetical protein
LEVSNETSLSSSKDIESIKESLRKKEKELEYREMLLNERELKLKQREKDSLLLQQNDKPVKWEDSVTQGACKGYADCEKQDAIKEVSILYSDKDLTKMI